MVMDRCEEVVRNALYDMVDAGVEDLTTKARAFADHHTKRKVQRLETEVEELREELRSTKARLELSEKAAAAWKACVEDFAEKAAESLEGPDCDKCVVCLRGAKSLAVGGHRLYAMQCASKGGCTYHVCSEHQDALDKCPICREDTVACLYDL